MMAKCPVCYTEYIEGQVKYCSTCGWDLSSYLTTFAGQVPEAFLEKAQAKLGWSRQMWARLQSTLSELQLQVEIGYEARAQLQAQISQLKTQLQHLQEERQSLKPSDLSDEIYYIDEPPLQSSIGVNYTKLRELVGAGKWKEADEETVVILINKNVENFPCEDLYIINQLWAKYSIGRFGFSLQKRIWNQCEHDAYQFGDRVGWRRGDSWLNYSELTFNNNAVLGHLPSWRGVWRGQRGKSSGALFFSRLEACKL